MDETLEIPEDLSPLGRKAAEKILETLGENPYTGGCKTFYSPDEWEDRGELYGLKSLLIVVHDGGSVAPYFNYDYCSYQRIEDMYEALSEVGCWAEPCTSWYTAIYPRGNIG